MAYTLRQYRNRLEKLQALQTEIDRLQKEADAIKEDIKTDMGDAEKVDGWDFQIVWSHVFSGRFDVKSFRKDHALLCDKYTVLTESRRFTYAID